MHRHFEDQLDVLAEKVLALGSQVEEAIGLTVVALVRRDADLARRIIEDDAKADRLELEIDSLCMELLALQQPFARDPRFVTTAMKITTDLVRVGDLCVNIAERTLELVDEPQLKPFIDIPLMAKRAQAMENRLLLASSPAQRRAVVRLLRHIVGTRADLCERWACREDLLATAERWERAAARDGA